MSSDSHVFLQVPFECDVCVRSDYTHLSSDSQCACYMRWLWQHTAAMLPEHDVPGYQSHNGNCMSPGFLHVRVPPISRFEERFLERR